MKDGERDGRRRPGGGHRDPPTPERWARIQEIFAAAVELEPGEREAFLTETTAGDAELRHEVMSLLAEHDRDPTFLDAGAPWLDLATERIPERIGPYRVLGSLGRGGMGQVFLAEQEAQGFRRTVAVKMVRPGLDTEDVLRRFRAERQILAGLDHPNIARLLDVGATGSGLPYLVLEYVEGESILEYCDARQLTVRARLRLFLTVCSAVQHAHRSLVVHRDLKPSNILVTADGTPKLLDFGIAKILDPERAGLSSRLTRAGSRVLTPEYSAPEQVRGDVVTTACDVYALGVLLYQLLAGRHPHEPLPAPRAELRHRILEVTPPPPSASACRDGEPPPARVARRRGARPSALRRALEGDLDTVVLKALRKEPDQRYASASTLAEDVRRHVRGQPVEARPPTLGYRAGKFVRRNRLAVATAAVLFVTLAGSTALTFEQSRRIREESERVVRERDKALEVRSFLLETFGTTGPDQPTGDTVSVRELLDRRAATVADVYRDDPVLKAEMMTVLAEAYEKLGLYEEAEPLAREALETRQKRFGPDHTDVLVSLNVLGWISRQLGHLERADTLLRDAVRVGRTVFGEEGDPRLARALNDYGAVREGLGEYEEAAELYRESLAMRRRHLGDDHLGVAITTSNLAVNQYRTGDFEAAAARTRESLRLFLRLLGPDHQRTTVARSNLAAVEGLLGGYDAAAEQHRKIVERHRRVLGPRDPRVAFATTMLANDLLHLGDEEAAVPLLREALDIQLEAAGPRSRREGTIRRVLGDALRRANRCEEAREEYEAGLDVLRDVVGDRHAAVADLMDGLGLCLQRLGRPREAEARLREAERIFAEALGPDHPQTLEAGLAVARLLIDQGRHPEAASLLDEVERGAAALEVPQDSLLGRARRARARLQASPHSRRP